MEDNKRYQGMNIQMNGVSGMPVTGNGINNYQTNMQRGMNNGLYNSQLSNQGYQNNSQFVNNQRGYMNYQQMNQQSKIEANVFGKFSMDSQQPAGVQIANMVDPVVPGSPATPVAPKNEGENTVTIAGLDDNDQSKNEYDPFTSAVPLQQQMNDQNSNPVGRTTAIDSNSNPETDLFTANNQEQQNKEYNRSELENMNQASLSNIVTQKNEEIEKNNLIEQILNLQIKVREQRENIDRLKEMVAKDR